MSIRDYYRSTAIDAFQTSHSQALRARLRDRVLGKPARMLLPFEPVRAILGSYNIGKQTLHLIQVDRVVGSLSRWTEFDRQFRPLSKSLQQRWVSVAEESFTAGWPPIRVHQIGNLFFVEDGHHRVSVARQLGYVEIEAVVTEYSLPVVLNPRDSLDAILSTIHARQRQTWPSAGQTMNFSLCGC